MLYVEGVADRILATKLGVPGTEIIRANDKGGVLRQLTRQQDCKGLVDEDPDSAQPNLLNRFGEVGTYGFRQLGLRVYQHGQRGNTLVALCPKLEDWLIRAARDAGRTLDAYGLPNHANRLHEVINHDLRKLERLIDDLLTADSPRMRRLQELLTS